VGQSARTALITGTTAVRTGRTPSILSALYAMMLDMVSLVTTQTASRTRSRSSTLNRSIMLSNRIVARIMNHIITAVSNVTITVTKHGHSIVAI